MNYKQRYHHLKAEMVTLKAQLTIESAKPNPDYELMNEVSNLIEVYKVQLHKIEEALREMIKKGPDIKMVVFLYHFCYGWSLRKIATKWNYSLVRIKQISAQISKEF